MASTSTNLTRYVGHPVLLAGFGFFTGLNRKAHIYSIGGGKLEVEYELDDEDSNIVLTEVFKLQDGTYADKAGWRTWNGWRIDFTSLPRAFTEHAEKAEKKAENRANRRARRKSRKKKSGVEKPPPNRVVLYVLKPYGSENTELSFEDPKKARVYLRRNGHSVQQVEKSINKEKKVELWTLDLRV